MRPTCTVGPGSYPLTSNHPGRESTVLSITLKRSAATLGVVAGLLAAAGPAGAAGQGGVAPEGLNDALTPARTAPRSNTLMETDGDKLFLKSAADAGTQVGSEGVKHNGRGFFDIPAELNY